MTRVLDASAVLAAIRGEPGSERVAPHLASGCISAVNLSEVVGRLASLGAAPDTLRETFADFSAEVVPFNETLAVEAGLLQPKTRALGLSLGDRACLALAVVRGLPALTADRAWADLDLGIEIAVIR